MSARVVDGIKRAGHVREGDPRLLGATHPDRLEERDPAPADGFGPVLTELERPHMPRLDFGRARNRSQHC